MDFIKGTIAGYIGAISVYPIDLVKSQMQLQTTKPNQIQLYRNGFDCFRQIVLQRGIKKLYTGSLIQIAGVGPEKAIKLFVNQNMLSNEFNPILSGAAAGLCQVLVTNPIEIIKIQYQAHLDQKMNFAKSIELIGGLHNLYKGAAVCAMRDIPFSGIYFPTYDLIKSKLLEWNFNNHQTYLLSGLIAAMPAAYCTTPMDVVKTRIQARPDLYQSFFQSATKLFVEEGVSAFFKGGFWRIAKSSPQFAITLYFFEIFTNQEKTF